MWRSLQNRYKKDIESYVDADFSGGWAQADDNNAENVMFCTRYVIMYAGCPVLWYSELQTEVALSTTEAEYIEFIQAMREVIPFMKLMKEVKFILDKHLTNTEVFCKVFEENKSFIAVA